MAFFTKYFGISTLSNSDIVVLIYRISDSGYPKCKPSWINNEHCLRNAVKYFPLTECKWHVIADNVSDETYNMILKYLPENCVKKFQLVMVQVL